MTKTKQHTLEPEDLMAYLDGELQPDRAAEAASHLAQCRECQKLAAEFEEISRKMVGWEVEPASARLEQGVEAAIDAPPYVERKHRQQWWVLRKWSSSWKFKLALSATAALILLVVAIPTFVVEHKMQYASIERAVDQPRSGPQVAQIPEQKAEPAAGFVNGLAATDALRSSNLPSRTLMDQRAAQGPAGKLALPKKQAEESAGRGPMIVRTANLSLISKDFDAVRARLDAIVKSHRGYIAQLTANSPTEKGRSLTGVIRVPSAQLDQAIAEIKSLGQVESETQNGQEVTAEYVDLEARLTNARNTEQRLTDILRNRTGKLSDVLEVEQEIDRVRGEIEQMQAQKKSLKDQVDLASINFSVREEYKSQLNVVPPSTGTQIRNAAVQGYRSLVDGLLALLLWLLASLPSLLVWGAVLFFPARFAWRKLRTQLAH